MSSLSRYAPTIARTTLGLAFFVFGLNGFLNFLPQPPMSGPPAAFAGALAASGYFFPLLKATEVAAGALLLANRFVPLALVLLAPVVVNIVAFHAFLAPAGLALPLLLAALGSYLATVHRESFAPVLRARVPSDRTAPSTPSLAPTVLQH